MTEKVNPSINRPIEAFKTSGAIALAGGSSEGWISPSSETSDIATQDTSIDETTLNEFAESSSASSLDVTIDPGEAFVYGAWVVKDTSTTVTLSASTTGQTVYVGWNKDGSDDTIVGLSAAFDNASGNTDERIPLYDFDTDGSGVTAVTDRREVGQYQSLSHLEIAEQLDVPIYSDTANAAPTESSLVYIDGSGGEESGLYVHKGSSYEKVSATTEIIQDTIDDTLSAGSNITLTYDDTAGTLTIDATDTNLTDEEVQDIVGPFIDGGANITTTYDDAGNALTIDTSALNEEQVEDAVNALLSDGNAITTTYDDANDTLTIDVVEGDIALSNLVGDSDNIDEGVTNLYYTDERAQDATASLLSGGNAIETTYDDANDALTIDVTESDIALGNLTGTTDSITEGSSNLFFTDERAQDAVGTIVGSLLSYDDATPSIVIDIGDDQELTFGAGEDVSVRYDSTDDSFKWRDNTNNTDRMGLDRTSGNLNIGGEITENTSL